MKVQFDITDNTIPQIKIFSCRTLNDFEELVNVFCEKHVIHSMDFIHTGECLTAIVIVYTIPKK
jgi:hypothetical protein